MTPVMARFAGMVASVVVWTLAWAGVAAADPWRNIGPDAPTTRTPVIDPGSALTLFVGTSTGLFRSADGGQSWTRLTNGLPIADVVSVSISSPAVRRSRYIGPSTVYALLDGRIYRSVDGGDSWTEAAPVPGLVSRFGESWPIPSSRTSCTSRRHRPSIRF